MIFVDTNVFISFLTEPVTAHHRSAKARAMELFSRLRSGEVQAVTGEVVHEIFYVTMSRRLLPVSVSEMCDIVRSLLDFPGWVFAAGERKILMRALDILQETPKLDFSDAVIAARAEAMGATLATFDRRLAKAYSGDVWE